jgi:hypothetical protein
VPVDVIRVAFWMRGFIENSLLRCENNYRSRISGGAVQVKFKI